MNVTDLIQSFFSGEHGAQLGRAAGLDAQMAQKALAAGLPMQLDALADHAGTPEGQSQIAEAVENLPRFSSVQDALAGPDGAMNLQRAGELLGPALLGGRADSITSAVASQTGAAPAGVGHLLQMAMPLLLSQLGQRAGLNPGNVGTVLGGLRGGLASLPGAAGLGAAGLAAAGVSGDTHTPHAADAAGRPDLAGAAPHTPPAPVPSMAAATPPMSTPSDAAPMSAALSSAGLLDFMRGQFSGASADKIGSVAGFGGSTAGRATQAALPLILNALANKGKTESGAGEVLSMARPFSTLSDDSGHLNTNLLSDTAELSRIEGQGRGLLGSLFGNVDELTGRLGTALGGSGSAAGRLLALLTPLVLSVLGGRARAGNVNAGGLSGLLGGLGGGLAGLLPSGLGGLGALLGAGGLAGASAAMGTVPPAPVNTPTPSRGTVPGPAASAPIPPAPAPATTDRRGGFPLWLIPLLAVLLLGGCWLLNQRPAPTTAGTTDTSTTGTSTTDGATTDAGTGTGTDAATDATGTDAGTATTDTTDAATGTAAAGGFAISEPAADATLAAGGFTMRGTGTAGDTLQVLEDGTSLGNVTVGEDGSWSLDVPSPAAGAHTYTVNGADGSALGTLAATVGAADANASAANCTDEYSLSISDGQTVTEPFRFGGKGQGQGYSVTVQRGERTVGTKNIPLDSTCGWSYQSKPGAGAVTYVVRPIGDAAAEPLSTVNITVGQ